MTREFKALMKLVGCAAQGTVAKDMPAELDWQKIEDLADAQGVKTLVGYALRLSPKLACPQQLRAGMIAEMRQAAFSNHSWKNAIMQLLTDMNDAGIHVLLMKGYAVADCYAAPDCRLSGDTDLLIAPEDEKLACKFLKEKGFMVNPRWKNGHHSVCNHPQYGCVELHVQLYDEIVEEVWFEKISENEFIKEPHLLVETEAGKYYTLGYTDHFIFLILHMIKHFILSGLTIQMMLDAALYFKTHADRIDADRVWDTVNSFHYDKLLDCVLWATIQHCGFTAEDFPGIGNEPPEQVDALLSDLEEGGWMGCSDEEARKQGWHEYNKNIMLKKRSKLGYVLHMLAWNFGILKTALFPPVQKLQKSFPYARKQPVLLPIAWLHRLFVGGGKAIKRGNLIRGVVLNESQIGAVGQKRANLFRNLGMM